MWSQEEHHQLMLVGNARDILGSRGDFSEKLKKELNKWSSGIL